LDEARAAAERFRAAKFDLQRRVLTAWADYTLTAERVRILREQADLARSVADTAKGRVIAGGAQADLLRADVALRTAEDAALNGEAELAAARATLNGMLARDANAPMNPPARTPEPRPVAADDAALLAAAVDQNPELVGLARQVEGRTDALELARLQWIPDINPTAAFTGSVSQALGAVVVLPTTVVQIRGGINQAEATLRGTEAALRQTKRDRAAEFVATLFMLRNAERQAALFGSQVVPAAQRIVTASQQQYSAGAATYLDLIESERALLDARLVVAEARAMREKRLAELEALMGTDVEMIGTPAPSFTSTPITSPVAKTAESRRLP
jgi:outer membrane protein TolC